jgi:hypothetical protein
LLAGRQVVQALRLSPFPRRLGCCRPAVGKGRKRRLLRVDQRPDRRRDGMRGQTALGGVDLGFVKGQERRLFALERNRRVVDAAR